MATSDFVWAYDFPVGRRLEAARFNLGMTQLESYINALKARLDFLDGTGGGFASSASLTAHINSTAPHPNDPALAAHVASASPHPNDTSLATHAALTNPHPNGPTPATAPGNRQTGTTYTVLQSDASKQIEMSSASPNTVTLPSGLTAGSTGTIVQYSTGATTVAAGAGVSIVGSPTLTIPARGGVLSWRYVSTTEVVVSTPTTTGSGSTTLVTGNRQSGTTYTLVISDAGKEIECSNASSCVVTIPTNASVAFPVGTILTVMAYSTGTVSVALAGGVTTIGTPQLIIPSTGGVLALRKTATDEWLISNGSPEKFILPFALWDETTLPTTGQKVAYTMPFSGSLYAGVLGVEACVTTVSTSGLPTFDVKKNGTTMLSTALTIDANEISSQTAATPPVLSVTSFVKGDVLSFHITTVGTGTRGPKVTLLGVMA